MERIFLEGGGLINIETNSPGDTYSDKQTGLGLEFGTGLQYNYRHLRIFVNPYLQLNSLVPFASSDGSHFNIFSSGYKFGLGYNF